MDYIKVFNCFHGSTKESIDLIIRNRVFTYEERENHWLGNGAYFFLDDKEKAAWWANMAVRKSGNRTGEIGRPSVLYIESKVEKSKVLDLNLEADQKVLKNFIAFLKENKVEINISNIGKITKEELQHYALCKIMDLLAESQGYKACCYLFANTDKPYLFRDLVDYGIINNKGNQLCVYDPTIIDFDTLKRIS